MMNPIETFNLSALVVMTILSIILLGIVFLEILRKNKKRNILIIVVIVIFFTNIQVIRDFHTSLFGGDLIGNLFLRLSNSFILLLELILGIFILIKEWKIINKKLISASLIGVGGIILTEFLVFFFRTDYLFLLNMFIGTTAWSLFYLFVVDYLIKISEYRGFKS